MIIRPLDLQDLEHLARIRLQAFAHTKHRDPVQLAAYLDRVFLKNPWGTDRIKSLVAVDSHGAVIGFIGAIARPFVLDGRSLLASCLSHFMVADRARGSGVGSALMDAALQGPHDFFWSDVANEATRRAMLRAGAMVAHLQSLTWCAPVQPIRAAIRRLQLPLPLRIVRRGVMPLLAMADRLAKPRQRDQSAIGVACTEDDATIVLDALGGTRLHPVYEAASLGWLLERLGERQDGSLVRSFIVRDADLQAVGFGCYLALPGLDGKVVKLAALDGHEERVLAALFDDARSVDVVTVSGRVDAQFLPALSRAGATAQQDLPWALVHSRDPALMARIAAGESTISRLDGEWWMTA